MRPMDVVAAIVWLALLAGAAWFILWSTGLVG